MHRNGWARRSTNGTWPKHAVQRNTQIHEWAFHKALSRVNTWGNAHALQRVRYIQGDRLVPQ
ncbi:hypothetical protein Pta6605_25440 [Pseudomonas amygdali pv. tabaci]|nr:hypothetical protein Pta6605_25440 [Pseudomonas amygdali pv. tabaci]